MKKTAALLLLVSAILFLFYTSVSQALNFSNAYLRLDRTKANTALSGLVCAKPSSAGAGTEAKVAVTFPSDFTISDTASNWTTSTSNLPSGTTAWPGIGSTASSVSSQTVTFSSSDLTSGSSTYCFSFTAASSTTGSTGQKTGSIETKTSGDSVIDEREFALTIVSNDQVTVSGTVPADPADFENELTILTTGTTFPQDTELDFRITYGSNLSYATSLTIVAEWSLGTISGESTPTVDILDYVSGSATDAYGSTSPVIDTVNRTITWEISSFPANTTGETVDFTLATNDSYPSSPTVEFTVSSHLEPPGATTTDSEVTRNYQYDSSAAPTSTPGPTSTPAPTTPTPTPIPSANSFTSIDIRTIGQDSATVFVGTKNSSTLSISYGTNVNNLSRTNTLSGLRKSGVFGLVGLEPETKYYFRATSTEADGTAIRSDFYTFTTAKVSVAPQVDPQTLVVISEDAIISFMKSLSIEVEEFKKLVVPESTSFKIKFALRAEAEIVSAKAVIRSKQTLGAESSGEDLGRTELIEVEPNVFSGALTTGASPGKYEIFISLRDINGNITEEKLSDLRVVERFKVLSKKNNMPIEGARVLLSIFNSRNNLYVQFPSRSISNGNPSFTDKNGQLSLVLPKAKYKAGVSSLKHKSQTVEFVIDYDEGAGYPTVYLEDSSLGILGNLNYYLSVLTEVFFTNTRVYFQNLTGSLRFFDLVSFVTLGTLVLLTLIAFSKKHHIPLSGMHTYFYYLFDHKKSHANYITGVVFDENDAPVPSANVYIQNRETEEIVGNARTNRKGEFFWKKRNGANFNVMVTAKGLRSSDFLAFKEREHLKFKITLEKDAIGLGLFENIERLFSRSLGMVFEVLIVLTIVFQILFILEFGLIRTLPFLIISILNLVLWLFVLHHSRHYK